MQRALICVIAVGGGLVLAGVLLAVSVPVEAGAASTTVASAVAGASVAACLGLAALVLRRQ